MQTIKNRGAGVIFMLNDKQKIFIIKKFYFSSNFKLINIFAKPLNFYIISSGKRQYYIAFPSSLACVTTRNSLICYGFDTQLIRNVFKSFQGVLYNWNLVFRQKFLVRGLGYKLTLYSNHLLQCKLGFSHPVLLTVNFTRLSVYILKNILLLAASNLAVLNQIITKLKPLRPYNIYKGKGLFLPCNEKKLKVIKKS